MRNDILVAPELLQQTTESRHELYLPYPDFWYPMNLRADEKLGQKLERKVKGGAHVFYDCAISDQDSQLPYVNPMYIREGKHLCFLQ